MKGFSLAVPIGAWHPRLEVCFASLAAQRASLQVALLDASGDQRVVDAADRWRNLFSFRHHGPDNGQADAIATGWAQTSGQILGWLNADDALYPDTLTKVLSRFEAADSPSVVYGHSTIVDSQNRIRGWQYGVEPPSERLGYAAAVSQPSCFFLREACDQAGSINRKLHYTMDWDLFLRLYHQGSQFAFIGEALSEVLWETTTKTASLTPRRREEIQRIDKKYSPDDPPASSLRGFRVQSLLDQSPEPVRELMSLYLMRNTKPFFGMQAHGASASGFILPIMHYRDKAVTGAELSFIGKRPSNLSATLDDAPCAVSNAQRTVRLLFPNEISSGQRASLKVTFDHPGGRFRWLQLVSG